MILLLDRLRVDRPIPDSPNPAQYDSAPLAGAMDARTSYRFLAAAQCALPIDAMGRPWTGANVFSSGDLKLDLLHNFFLECGARANKIRVYEVIYDPTARSTVGFFLVRGGVHVVAHAKALQKLTGFDVSELLPIPNVSNKMFPGAKIHGDKGLHRIPLRFSPEDSTRTGDSWNGPHPKDRHEL